MGTKVAPEVIILSYNSYGEINYMTGEKEYKTALSVFLMEKAICLIRNGANGKALSILRRAHGKNK
jgi:hypothetical protein